ncbi:MAG TPA: hypothetical protein VMD30_03430 [Tepidisphaeraceae bacterium]|nr:hypothetical protein [Tepidisphaeraceae bacterium]
MPTDRFPIFKRLNESAALQAAADLAQIEFDAGQEIDIDFSETVHYEPFAMLFLGAAIRRLRHRAGAVDAVVRIKTLDEEDGGFPGHMGFWRSIGAPVGRDIGASAGKQSYLPITRLTVEDMYRRAGGDPRGSGLVESEAAKLVKILCNPFSKSLFEALTYALRELIRNVIEHAMTSDIWIAGTTWPKRDFVQIAILDEGRGIRASLADNPELRFETDAKALSESIRPGVTRNKGRQRTPAEIERWEEQRHALPLSIFDNTGYGLYMISTFCREAGGFLIASGSSYLSLLPNGEISGATLHRGTALRLFVQPTKVGPAFERLFEAMEQRGAGHKPLLSASKLRELGLDTLTASE